MLGWLFFHRMFHAKCVILGWLFFHRMFHVKCFVIGWLFFSQNPYLDTKYVYNLGSLSFPSYFRFYGRFRPCLP